MTEPITEEQPRDVIDDLVSRRDDELQEQYERYGVTDEEIIRRAGDFYSRDGAAYEALGYLVGSLQRMAELHNPNHRSKKFCQSCSTIHHALAVAAAYRKLRDLP